MPKILSFINYIFRDERWKDTSAWLSFDPTEVLLEQESVCLVWRESPQFPTSSTPVVLSTGQRDGAIQVGREEKLKLAARGKTRGEAGYRRTAQTPPAACLEEYRVFDVCLMCVCVHVCVWERERVWEWGSGWHHNACRASISADHLPFGWIPYILPNTSSFLLPLPLFKPASLSPPPLVFSSPLCLFVLSGRLSKRNRPWPSLTLQPKSSVWFVSLSLFS